ncbi:TolC family protein [Sulfurimonas autotrophica]|uniref:Outer membrane efflux protein n=1 Tax=Sulfurimonas autotrophica (strain ATCC BAA-671 / DSM 16294 / JCM 11897 / OK10) TaxID=563040 RepID=E0UP49_SULAO|nr:TolC family protein [Sulfurimonas autotrophica]ADN08082.1 outer membrane efflux protein [Sulfurimonas autotrophica DSM 16294]
MKRLLLVPFIVWNLQAQDYEGLLKDAMQTSPYLKANALEVKRADEQSSLIQRYKNPTLSLEASQFSPDIGKSKAGYRAALSQPIRLWGVGDDRANLAVATKEEAQGLVTLKRAEFVKVFSLLYNEYITQTALFHLAKEEFAISKNIAAITKERYEAGTTAKVKYLRAKVDLAGSKNALDEKKAMQIASYYKLLAFSGLEDEKALDDNYVFKLSNRAVKEAQNNSAELHYLQTQQNSSSAKAKLNTNKIEWMNLYAEYEAEPDQSIARVGVDIPLAVFNTKKEEKRIAALQAKESEFLLQNQKIILSSNLTRLKKELLILQSVISSTQKLYNSQKELLKMYEDGYKIASINLLELQNIKNQMIQTKEKEITLQNKINKNIVIYNYEVGEYNE